MGQASSRREAAKRADRKWQVESLEMEGAKTCEQSIGGVTAEW